MAQRASLNLFKKGITSLESLSFTQATRQYATEAKRKEKAHPPRRTYLHNQYESIIGERVLFVFQHNNLSVQEFTALRQELASLGAPAKLTVLRSGVFNAVLRKTQYANLSPLVAAGPTCVLHTNVQDGDHPDLLKNAMNIINKNKKLMLLGGKVDSTLLTHADVLKVVDLPSLPQLRAELLGVLQAPASRLVSTLSSPASQLHSVLGRRTD